MKYVLMLTILCLTAMEFYAMYLGHNGIMFASVLAVIAAAAGIAVPNQVKEKLRLV